MVCRKTLQQREVDIIRRMHQVLHMPVTKIAEATERSKSSIYRALDESWDETKKGRPPALGKKETDVLMQTLKKMQQQVQAKREITLAMLKARAKCKASCHCIRRALRGRNVLFRKMREKPILTTEDRRARFAFAKKYYTKTKAWWIKNVHMHIDVKKFPAYVNAPARDVAALRMVRGAYRQPGQGLDEAYVVVSKEMRYNPGVKSVKVLAGVGKGRVRVWHVLKKRWCGRTAASVYRGPILQGSRYDVLAPAQPYQTSRNADRPCRMEN